MKGPLYLFCLLFATNSSAQLDTSQMSQLRAYEDTLEVLADGMMLEQVEERMYYCEQFIKKLVTTLKVPYSYYYDFENFQNISILSSGDDQFRIFTWQLQIAKGDYRYYGAIQMNQKGLKLIPLIDRSFNMQNPETEQVSNEAWYGAVYYHIIPFVYDNKPAYMLFGYDSNDYFNRIKLLDVLTFDESGVPNFGAPVFQYPDNITHNRFMLTFAADAQIRLNFDPKLGMIVFDHLINDGDEASMETRMVPDGSYSGFRYDDGQWLFVEKIFDQVSEKPPHEVPLPEEKLGLVKPDPTKKKY